MSPRRVALVTGGTRGIGWAVCQRLAREEVLVAVGGRDRAAAEARARELRGSAMGVRLEVTDPAVVGQAVVEVLEARGRIDILVNSAGIIGPLAPAAEYPLAEWRRVMATNLDGAFLCIQAVLPHMIAGGWGRIVNVASVAGKEGNPFMPAYSASKAGLLALTKSLGKELATSGVLVNAVTPGIVDTDMVRDAPPSKIADLVAKIPMGRIGRPEEVAALVAWLCSQECTFSTGAAFDLSGGRTTY